MADVKEHGSIRVQSGVLEHGEGELLQKVVLQFNLLQVGQVQERLRMSNFSCFRNF